MIKAINVFDRVNHLLKYNALYYKWINMYSISLTKLTISNSIYTILMSYESNCTIICVIYV